MSRKDDYDPTEYSSPEEYARSQANMEREFGMPATPHENTPIGRMINQHHYDHDKAMNDELGWHDTTEANLRRKHGLE